MKRNFDKILLGVLWLMTTALATTFWMNIRYGFDIFSAAHWEYLSGLQANRTNIKPEFYMSLLFALIITLAGLYIIVRPRFRKIPMPVTQTPQPVPNAPAKEQSSVQSNANVPTYAFTGARPKSPASVKYTANRQPPRAQFTPPTKPMNATVPPVAPKKKSENPLARDINTILESAGYVMKPCKHIGKLNNPIVALGYNQTLWIATSSAPATDMLDAIQTLVGVFDDTLSDSANDIRLRGCIISPTTTPDNELISAFANIDEFRQFMNKHKNIKQDDFDTELFDAISTYISTVTSYIGKE